MKKLLLISLTILFLNCFDYLTETSGSWHNLIDWYGKIPAGDYREWKIYLPYGAQVKGTVAVDDLDINFQIIGPFGYIKNEEKTKFTSFNFVANGGYYRFILSNTYSLFTSKMVKIKVEAYY